MSIGSGVRHDEGNQVEFQCLLPWNRKMLVLKQRTHHLGMGVRGVTLSCLLMWGKKHQS